MKRLAPYLLLITLSLAAFALGFSSREVVAGRPLTLAPYARLVGKGQGLTPPQLYESHFERIASHYSRRVSGPDLRHAAMEGLVATLGDPHTNYFEPVTAEQFSTTNRGDLVGVGARLGEDPLGAKVASVFEQGPASRAGLKMNDVITAVDGLKVAGMPTTEIVSKIRGEEGTVVRLTIQRPTETEPMTLRIIRAKVEIPSVESKMLPGQVGFLAVTNFAERTPEQFSHHLDSLIQQGAKGLVIDMRENPGGLLEAAADMLGRFASRKTVVTMKFRRGTDIKRTPGGMVVPFPRPVVVLIDGGSASASEIFAGCLRDYGIAKLVGTHSYGKTSVQNVHPIPSDQSSVKVTVAKYFLPSGTNFDRKVDEDGTYLSGGLKPDYLVELPNTGNIVLRDPETDPQLKKALEVVVAQAGG